MHLVLRSQLNLNARADKNLKLVLIYQRKLRVFLSYRIIVGLLELFLPFSCVTINVFDS